jgi:hypothetical protein
LGAMDALASQRHIARFEQRFEGDQQVQVYGR